MNKAPQLTKRQRGLLQQIVVGYVSTLEQYAQAVQNEHFILPNGQRPTKEVIIQIQRDFELSKDLMEALGFSIPKIVMPDGKTLASEKSSKN